MWPRITLCLALALATLTLAGAVAWAETLTMSPAREITLVSLGAIIFETNLGVHVDCNITLSGSLTTGSFASVRGTTIGSLSRATVSACTGGRVTPLIEARTPWRIVYEAVDGSFPQEVTGYQLKVEGTRVLAEIPGLASCLTTGDIGVDVPTTYSEIGEVASDIISTTGLVRLQRERESFSSIVRLSGPFNCPTSPSVLGTYRLEPQQSIRQEGTRIDLSIGGPITFGAVEIRTATLRNEHPTRTEQLTMTAPVYLREGSSERFRIEGGTCRELVVLQPRNGGGGLTCTIAIRFLGPRPASSRVAVDLRTNGGMNPAIQGVLSAP